MCYLWQTFKHTPFPRSSSAKTYGAQGWTSSTLFHTTLRLCICRHRLSQAKHLKVQDIDNRTRRRCQWQVAQRNETRKVSSSTPPPAWNEERLKRHEIGEVRNNAGENTSGNVAGATALVHHPSCPACACVMKAWLETPTTSSENDTNHSTKASAVRDDEHEPDVHRVRVFLGTLCPEQKKPADMGTPV